MDSIAICHRKGSFSESWIKYCQENLIDFFLVDAYSSSVISELKECAGFMWHWHHLDYKALLFARQLTMAVENAGKLVYPSTKTVWHFDDKVGQKYLLESLDLPIVSSYSFYDQEEALEWAKNTEYPKIFKLRGGASSRNVRLVRNFPESRYLILRAFSKQGFPLLDRKSTAKDFWWRFKRDKNIKALFNFLARSVAQYVQPIISTPDRMLPTQKGYVYFQDFVPDNNFDDRLVVIGTRCFCLRRHCRKGDFRASGSGLLQYDIELFPKESIALAFAVAEQANTQSIAIDIIYDEKKEPKIIEISYCFSRGAAYENCLGYFDRDLNWHNERILPEIFIIEDFLSVINHA